MDISSLDDCRLILEDAKTGIALRLVPSHIQPLLDALELILTHLQERDSFLSEALSEAQIERDEIRDKLFNLRYEVNRALGYIKPGNSAYEILNDALQDSGG